MESIPSKNIKENKSIKESKLKCIGEISTVVNHIQHQ